MGVERPLGERRVDFSAVLRKLASVGYEGARSDRLTIEREIPGPKQIQDILRGKAYLERMLAAMKISG